MRTRQRGLSLVELLVALTIGSLLLVGAVFVYTQSRNTNTVSDAIARLQENARYAMSILEPDVQLAGYYGFSNVADDFKFIAGGSTAAPIAAAQMQQSDVQVGALAAGFHACGDNFALDLLASVQGGNDSYGLPCPPAGGGAQPETDTLTIRRSATLPLAAATEGRLQLLVNRLSRASQYVLADGELPAFPPLDPDTVQVRDLVVRTYYVAQHSDAQPGVPALRVKSLDAGGFTDEEVMSGVEDFQVQLGYDTGDYDGDGVIDPGMDGDADGLPDAPNGIATRYVDPDDVPVGFQVVAVRLWLLVRAERPEVGFKDDRAYTYAGAVFGPTNDGFRRVLVSRTIQLRNARSL
jgi:type IV pilus assembly protein PilW